MVKGRLIDNEFLLIDRLDVIRKTIEKYGEENFVISFSGGEDSTVLHYLVDMALPENKIPRIFIDTGIEYESIRNFVNELKAHDERFDIIKPSKNLQEIFKEYGYPFKSKEHSLFVEIYQRSGMIASVERYYNPPEHRRRFGCPKILRYQFEGFDGLKISNMCCTELKKKPFTVWQEENNRPYKLTGERIEEGGLRASHGDCLVIDKKGTLKKFKPLNPMNNEWIKWFVESQNIELCELYYPPYNFTRTGCKACPYNVKIASDLATLHRLLPREYAQAKWLWGKVYDEYIRIGYRLKRYPDEKEE